ncbi:hypothetical protein ACIGC1_18595 [Peribacillus butanolivorans]|uniref:hypothetical protein n=1 Tax=Peribacillus butanolivorans TaxID=421767 RepID=UPI0037C6F78D
MKQVVFIEKPRSEFLERGFCVCTSILLSVTLKSKGIPHLYEEYKEYCPISVKGMKILENKIGIK